MLQYILFYLKRTCLTLRNDSSIVQCNIFLSQGLPIAGKLNWFMHPLTTLIKTEYTENIIITDSWRFFSSGMQKVFLLWHVCIYGFDWGLGMVLVLQRLVKYHRLEALINHYHVVSMGVCKIVQTVWLIGGVQLVSRDWRVKQEKGVETGQNGHVGKIGHLVMISWIGQKRR